MKNLERDIFIFAPAHPKRIVQRFILPAIFNIMIPVDYLPIDYKENLKKVRVIMEKEKAEAESMKANLYLEHDEIYQLLTNPLDRDETIICWIGKMSFLFTILQDNYDNESLIKTILKDYEDKFHIFRNIWRHGKLK